jgi:hypothetical protein
MLVPYSEARQKRGAASERWEGQDRAINMHEDAVNPLSEGAHTGSDGVDSLGSPIQIRR